MEFEMQFYVVFLDRGSCKGRVYAYLKVRFQRQCKGEWWKPVKITGDRLYGRVSGTPYVGYVVSVSSSCIIICRLFNLSLTDQTQITVGLSDLRYRFLARLPLLEGLNTPSAAVCVLCGFRQCTGLDVYIFRTRPQS